MPDPRRVFLQTRRQGWRRPSTPPPLGAFPQLLILFGLALVLFGLRLIR